MTGFLTGVGTAIALSVLTWFALEEFSVTSIEKIENPSVNLDGLDYQYSPLE